MKYAHVLRAVYGSPWAITPDLFAVILDQLDFRAAGGGSSQAGGAGEAVTPRASRLGRARQSKIATPGCSASSGAGAWAFGGSWRPRTGVTTSSASGSSSVAFRVFSSTSTLAAPSRPA